MTSLLPLVLEDVGFSAGGRTILSDVSAVIDAGPRTIVLGANGAGKSVLLRLCHGLLAPTAGRIRWHAEDPGRPPRQAMVFQRPVMLRRSALANVVYPLAVAGVPGREAQARALEALELVGLGRLAAQPARHLSAGEQQRVALARAWVFRPEVLFLDEPTASLDPSATREVESSLGALHDAGVKLVMTTHDLGQARRMGDDILFLHQGRLRERGHGPALFEQPESAEARAFLRGELPWD